MKKIDVIGILICSFAGAGHADIYTDVSGDAFGMDNLDIVSVNITDDGSDISFTLEVADLNADWGNYMIFVDNQDGGSGDNDNPWIRNVAGMSGTDVFVGSWINGGGGTLSYAYEEGGWGGSNDEGAPVLDWGLNTITWEFSDVVNEGGNGFYFNVGTTGGGQGDPAIDLLLGSGANWGGQANSGGEWAYYEFSTVPAPGALVVLGMAGLIGRRRS
tara:strand:- start:24 stop:671 length:648 start_codon:yes stop_codon:yes gene_type:complete